MPLATMLTSVYLVYPFYSLYYSSLNIAHTLAASVYLVNPFTFHTDPPCHHAYIFVSSVYPVYPLTLHSNLPLQVLYPGARSLGMCKMAPGISYIARMLHISDLGP